MNQENSNKENRYVILPVVTADSYPMYQIHILLGENPIPFHIGDKALIYKERDQAVANVLLLIKYAKSFTSKIYGEKNTSFEGDSITVSGDEILLVKNKYEITGLEKIEEILVAKSTN